MCLFQVFGNLPPPPVQAREVVLSELGHGHLTGSQCRQIPGVSNDPGREQKWDDVTRRRQDGLHERQEIRHVQV